MQHDNKNFILAIALSLGIIIIWQYYFSPVPDPSKIARQNQTTTQKAPNAADKTVNADKTVPTPPGGNTSAQTAPTTPIAPTGVQPLELVLAKTKRVRIDTPSLTGSINLTGAVFDDLRLKRYHETIDKNSPIIRLLAPSGTKHGFFADQGWQPASGSPVKVPTSQSQWTVEGNATLTPASPVTLTFDNGEGLVFKRVISVDDSYMFNISQSVTNNTGKPIALFPYARVQRQEIPKLQGVFVIHEGLIGALNKETPTLKYKDAKEGDRIKEVSNDGGWVGITDKYWAVAAIPDQKKSFEGVMSYVPLGGRDGFQSHYVLSKPVTIAAGATGSYENMMFAGAKVVQKINDYTDKFNLRNFDNLVDWGWFYLITKPMFWLLHLIQGFVGNFGIAILLITVIVKAVFFPLANKSYKSMAQMKKLQPEMNRIKERYGDDKAEMQKKIMEMYKKEKVSPLSGCLPMIVQIPVFFSLYKVLFVTIEMRHAPFYLWIKDLSAPDPTSIFNLFGLLPWQPTGFLLIGVLPLLMGITMWVQMKLNPAPPDPVQAQMFNLMPIIFTFMLGTFPAGLVLYWAWNNLLSIIQQWVIMKKQGVEITLLQNMKDGLPKFLFKNKEAK